MVSKAGENYVLQTLLDTTNTDHVKLSMEEESERAADAGYQELNARRSPQQYNKPISKLKTHEAAEVGDISLLRELATVRPGELGLQDNKGNTPLHLAAKGNHLDCCKILLELGTKELYIKNKAGNSPLLLSITTGNTSTEITKLLIDKGSKLDLANKCKQTALHITSEKGNVETLKLLLGRDKNCLNAKNSEQLTPLHVAARNGHWKVCIELVKTGANLEAKDGNGSTPLHWAAKMGFYECCKNLLEHKASINSTNYKGNTPLHLLCSSKKEKPECAKLLIDHGADVNAQNNVGETPFHLSFRSHLKISEVFLGQDVKLQLTDKNGRTVWHFAAERLYSDYVKLVMKIKVSSKDLINKLDNQGKTALHIAISKRAIETCKFLIKVGADGTIPCGTVGTALHMAAQYDLGDICDYLIIKGVKVDIKNSEGLAPLHIAAKEGHEECCKVLCKRGASAVIRDGDGMTPLHHAAKGNHSAKGNLSAKGNHSAKGNLSAKGNHSACCETLLKKYPHLVNISDNYWRTPLHVAVEVNSLDCCKVILTPKTDIWAKSLCGSPIKMAYDGCYHDIFRLLLHDAGVKKTHSEKDINFRDLLEKSLERQDRKMVESIINSCFWEEAFMPSQDTLMEKQKNGNLRMLVKPYPDLVNRVLDKCLPTAASTVECDETQQRQKRCFLVHYLDEAYPIPETIQRRQQNSQPRQSFETESGGLAAGVMVAPVDQAWRSDHLLERILRYNHHHLLKHPLITCWLRYKWLQYISIHHYACLAMTFLLALLLTTFTAISWDWTYMQNTYNLTRFLVCPPGDEQFVGPEVKELLRQEGKVPNVLGYIILFMLVTGILHDIYKIIMLRKRFLKIESLLSPLCAAASFIFICSFTSCSQSTFVREDWQWQVGVISVLSSWLYVFLLMRHGRWCSNFLFHVKHLFHTFFKITIPLLAVGTAIFFVYKISNKGKTAYNQTWKTFLQIFSYQWVGTALLVGLIIVVCLVMLDKSKNQQIKKYKDLCTVAFVKMTMDFDLLYPILRKKNYAFWIPEHKVNFYSQCNCLKQCLPCMRKEEFEEFNETENEYERDVSDGIHINEKIEKLQQNVTELHKLINETKKYVETICNKLEK